MSATIALTGGTGFIGSAVGRRLLAEGRRVRALRRRGAGEQTLLGVASEWVEGDLEDADSLTPLVRGADCVVHCAGVVRGLDRADFDRVNVAGTARLLEATRREGAARRVLFLSSLAAREPGLSAYARSKALQEAAVSQAGGDWVWVGLRPPAVYGPGDREMLLLFRWMQRGLLPLLGPADGRFSLLFVEDLAEAVAACLQASVPSGAVYELHDGRPGGYSWEQVCLVAEKVFGRRTRCVRIPETALRGVARLNALLARLSRHPPMLTPGKVRELRHPDWVCNNSAVSNATGWKPRIDFATGLRRTLGFNP